MEPPLSAALTEEFSNRAARFAQAAARRELNQDVFCETTGRQSLWTEFRTLFKQHMRLWQPFTTVTLAVDAGGSVAGWLVDIRKTRCGPQTLSDVDVETRARTIGQIGAGLRLAGIRRVPIDRDRGMAIASFASPVTTGAQDVYVNHTTGEVIGFLPPAVGGLVPMPLETADTGRAEALAWQQIQADLAIRVGPETAGQAVAALKLVPKSAGRDGAGRVFWEFELWRHFSVFDVSIDQVTKEIVGWYFEALQSDAPSRSIDETAAVKAARAELTARDGVSGPKVTFERDADSEQALVHWWHAEQDINIEGDQTTVLLNATTGQPYSVWRKWRRISPELLRQTGISPEQAVRVADNAIHRDPAGPPGRLLGRSVIQVAQDREQPGPVHDALVWRVGYSNRKNGGFVEVAVDNNTSEVVRITGW